MVPGLRESGVKGYLMTREERALSNAKRAVLIRRMIIHYWCYIFSLPLWFFLLGFIVEEIDDSNLAVLLFLGSLTIYCIFFWFLRCPFCNKPVLTIPLEPNWKFIVICTPFLPKKCAYCSRDLRVKKAPLAGVEK